jgi:hypothetical protein
MREDGEMIGKLDREFFRVFSVGWGGEWLVRALTSEKGTAGSVPPDAEEEQKKSRLGFVPSHIPKCEGPGAPIFGGRARSPLP